MFNVFGIVFLWCANFGYWTGGALWTVFFMSTMFGGMFVVIGLYVTCMYYLGSDMENL